MNYYFQNFPNDIWMFEEIILDTGKQQNVFTRILAPFTFYPVNKNKKPIFNQKIKEEHTHPQNLIGKAQFVFFSLENSRFLQIWKWPNIIISISDNKCSGINLSNLAAAFSTSKSGFIN